LAAIQALASARNAASCGVSSKFMTVVLQILWSSPRKRGPIATGA
jgi:hypothetical protein